MSKKFKKIMGLLGIIWSLCLTFLWFIDYPNLTGDKHPMLVFVVIIPLGLNSLILLLSKDKIEDRV